MTPQTATLETSGLEVVPLGGKLGAEVRGIDGSVEFTPATKKALRAALDTHKALLFRGQNLVPVERHIRFAQAFGPLGDIADTLLGFGKRKNQPDEYPECVSVISNIKVGGTSIGSLGDGECFWHSDSNFVEVPPAACVLHAIEIPPEGGNTAFLDMVDALKALPADVRQRIEGKQIRHSKVYKSNGDVRPAFAGNHDISTHPGPEHPMVRTLEDGKKCLFLGRRLGAYIIGLPVNESEALLDELWAHTVKDARVWSHRWKVGDVVVWDNRTTMHHRDPFDPNSRRRMHKVQVAGVRPA